MPHVWTIKWFGSPPFAVTRCLFTLCLDRQQNGLALFPLSHLPLFTAFFTVKHVNKWILALSNWINVNWLSYLTASEFVFGISSTFYVTSVQTVSLTQSTTFAGIRALSLAPWHGTSKPWKMAQISKPTLLLTSWAGSILINWNPLRCSFFHALKTWNSNKSWEFIEAIYKSLAKFCDLPPWPSDSRENWSQSHHCSWFQGIFQRTSFQFRGKIWCPPFRKNAKVLTDFPCSFIARNS